MSEHVYKSVEITGSSPEGVTQAIDRAVAKASQTAAQPRLVRADLACAARSPMARVAHYQVTEKIGFRLED